MGLPPTFLDYAGGAACHLCEDVIFNGKTPFFVEAWVFSINICPGFPAPNPNGNHLLTQINPCQWQKLGPFWRYQWTLLAGQSLFWIQAGPSFAFADAPFVACESTFINDNLICNLPAAVGIDGWVTVFWGPGIGL